MILIVEDNKLLAKNIKTILEMNNFSAEIVESAENAENTLKEKNYKLIILDINLPWKNWFTFLKELRKKWNNIPVLILTSKNTIDDKVEWLELWADDYMTKPFDMTEFLARIKAILRRQSWIKTDLIKINDLEIYPDEEKVLKNKSQIWLSSLEFKLLMYFIKNKWKILNRQDIYEQVWGDFEDHMFSRTVDVYIANLRKKLGKEFIKTRKWSWYYI
jgi:DNA-binding response OmpR family regulator